MRGDCSMGMNANRGHPKSAFSQHGPLKQGRRLTPLLSNEVKLPLVLVDVGWHSRAVAEVCQRRPFGA
jgi:hypothetical protein